MAKKEKPRNATAIPGQKRTAPKSGSLLDSLCLSEDLDLVAFSNRNHGLLPGAGLTKLIANTLRLSLNVNGVNLNDLYILEARVYA